LRPSKMYTLSLRGCGYKYEIGDVYTISLSYSVGGGATEEISTEAEICSVSFARSVGDIGSTTLVCRVTPEAWEVTTAKNATIIGAGRAQWIGARSHVVVVAASTYCGQADYYCQGSTFPYLSSDQFVLKKAIDYLDSVGGGEIRLTRGTYYLYDYLLITKGCTIIGEGDATIIAQNGEGSTFSIVVNADSNCRFEHFRVTGNRPASSIGAGIVIDGDTPLCSIKNVTIDNIYGYGWGYGIYNASSGQVEVRECVISDITCGSTFAAGIGGCNQVESCYISDITSDWIGAGYGIANSTRCSKNHTSNTATAKYYLSYADAGTSYACADTATGGYNS
jgi:hypothetical protein